MWSFSYCKGLMGFEPGTQNMKGMLQSRTKSRIPFPSAGVLRMYDVLYGSVQQHVSYPIIFIQTILTYCIFCVVKKWYRKSQPAGVINMRQVQMLFASFILFFFQPCRTFCPFPYILFSFHVFLLFPKLLYAYILACGRISQPDCLF